MGAVESKSKQDERRRHVRATLIGPARFGSKAKSEHAVSAVLDNANQIGAGFHAKEPLGIKAVMKFTALLVENFRAGLRG